MEIKSFCIKQLHRSLNFKLEFEDNSLILLGENGSCKTTIIKMLYYTLSLQWEKLAQYNFDCIEIVINDTLFNITRDEIIVSSSIRFNERLFRRLPFEIRQYIRLIQDGRKKLELPRLEILCKDYGIPVEMILQELRIDEIDLSEEQRVSNENIQRKREEFEKVIANLHILYLPTYRRIEQDLKVVLEGRIDEDEFSNRRIKRNSNTRNYTELIEFGMLDVEDAIKTTLADLKESYRANLNHLTLGYLGDIVNEKYNEINYEEINSIEEDTIHKIMNRVDESILSAASKEKLVTTLKHVKEIGKTQNEHDKVVCHYFLKLYDSHKELVEKESAIRDFAESCSKYLENKTVFYDSPKFEFSIRLNNDEQQIELQQLSSGEKQIVSLFNHLYLSNYNNYMVLIDEPELSLSVKWQKTFLEDVHKGTFCSGLVAVTHSPFIFDNSLDKYAHGIDEFRG